MIKVQYLFYADHFRHIKSFPMDDNSFPCLKRKKRMHPKHHESFVEVYAHLSNQGVNLRFGICNLDFNE